MPITNHVKKARDAAGLIKAVRGEAQQEVCIVVIAEPAVEAEFRKALGGTGIASSPVLTGANSIKDDRDIDTVIRSADLAIVLLSPGKTDKDLEAMVRHANRAKKKLVIVTGSNINDWLVERLADVFRISGEDVLFISLTDEHTVKTTLVSRILAKLNGKDVPLAAALPVFREEVARRIITHTANQNAMIGVAVFVPGADMPLMTANQVRMILRLSAAYNQELSMKRLTEVFAVIGSGFALRAAARQVMGFIPVAGWAVKGVIGYSGTVAMGRLAKKYFEELLDQDGSPRLPNSDKKGESFEPLASDRKGIAAGREAKPLHKS
ncbi:MAG TPA: DUF697 domain-containing protein [Candidatus Aquicultor sp.]|jgi:uncharacterized protein (DUF697 family)